MKIDFHIHTKPNQYLDSYFDFNEDGLIQYVSQNKFDAIAITNHNIFDRQQFLKIVELLKNIKCAVFPGMEVSLEGGHILLIGDNNENTMKLLEHAEYEIRKEEKDEHYRMQVETFNLLVNDNDFLIIPHYCKTPKIPKNIIDKIASDVFVGEVQGPKKFYSMRKENTLTPVWFSDIRIKNVADKEEFRKQYLNVTKYTFLKCDNPKFGSIKNALRANDSTSLTSTFEDESFEILDGEAKASIGINVLLGERSSGKTYTLDHIYGQGNGHTLYIKQFDIVKRCEESKFDEFVADNSSVDVIAYLRELNSVFDYIEEMPNAVLNTKLTEYLTSLLESAKQNLNDAYSMCPLFKMDSLSLKKDAATEIYKSLDTLLSSTEYKNVIFEKLSIDAAKELYYKFISIAKEITLKNTLINRANKIAENVGQQLEHSSASIRVKEADFKKLFKYRYAKKKFDFLISHMQNNLISSKPLFGKFNKTVELKREVNKTKLKTNLRANARGYKLDYLINLEPYDAYFAAKIDEQISQAFSEARYKIFFSVSNTVITTNGFELSGGQKAEFILLSELANYRFYDMILIDEMESSFDNPFLNKEIVAQIKAMSKDAVVFVSTHNNNLGVSLNPDYYIYHQIKVDEEAKQVMHKKYYGSSTSSILKDNNGDKINLSDVLVTTMEANDKAYKERKAKYENS